MNASLQMILNLNEIEKWCQYFPLDNEVATEWLNIKKEKEGVVNPISLLRAIHKKFDHFSVLEQNDSVEYLRCIILSLAEQEKFNFIQHLFQGQLESHMKCLKCNKNFYKRDDFFDLSIPINEMKSNRTNWLSNMSSWFGFGGKTSIYDCLYGFFQTEILTGPDRYKCENCKELTDTEKTIRICKLPDILIIQLKRFRYDSFNSSKISTPVSFPLKNLDLQLFYTPVYGVSDTVEKPESPVREMVTAQSSPVKELNQNYSNQTAKEDFQRYVNQCVHLITTDSEGETHETFFSPVEDMSDTSTESPRSTGLQNIIQDHQDELNIIPDNKTHPRIITRIKTEPIKMERSTSNSPMRNSDSPSLSFSSRGESSGLSLSPGSIMDIDEASTHPLYNCISIIQHRGRGLESGHYVAFVKSNDGTWYLANDDNIEKLATKSKSFKKLNIDSNRSRSLSPTKKLIFRSKSANNQKERNPEKEPETSAPIFSGSLDIEDEEEDNISKMEGYVLMYRREGFKPRFIGDIRSKIPVELEETNSFVIQNWKDFEAVLSSQTDMDIDVREKIIESHNVQEIVLPCPENQTIWYISAFWLFLYQNLTSPGPITQMECLCTHGKINRLLHSHPEKLIIPISSTAKNRLVETYGIIPRLKENQEENDPELDAKHRSLCIKEGPIFSCPECEAQEALWILKRKEETELLSKCESIPLDDADDWAVVDSIWVKQFLAFKNGKAPPPGPISNTRILDKDEKSIKPGYCKGSDYQYVHPSLFWALFDIYGGGPAISVHSNGGEFVINPPRFASKLK